MQSGPGGQLGTVHRHGIHRIVTRAQCWKRLGPRFAVPRLKTIVLLVLSVTWISAQEPVSDRSTLDAAFRGQLESLAAKCEELKLPEQAQRSRQWMFPRDPGRQYLFVLETQCVEPVSGDTPDLVTKWTAKFMELRRGYAAKLFDAARQEAAHGSAVRAYQMLYEVVHHDPQHAEARRILNAASEEDHRPRGRSMRLNHPQFGWPRGRWWQVESPHFQIVTDLNLEAGMELARRLELFHDVWRQLFFDTWGTREWLKEHFAGRSPRVPGLAKHKVVLFRDRREYLERLAPVEPKITVTLGYYLKGSRTSYFHGGDESATPVWYHEATHQLFQEIGGPVSEVGEKWNFWVVEGIALYMESLVHYDGYCTVGGFDADRLQVARSRLLGGETLMKLDDFTALGRENLQMHSDIRKLYTQAAGMTHYLMDAQQGRHREALIRFIALVYAGQDAHRSLQAVGDVASPEFHDSMKSFLVVRDADLQFLLPPELRRSLSLMRAEISDKSLRVLANSPNLEWLDLSLTRISNEGLNHLEGLPSLKRLSLVGVRIDDAAAEAIARFSGLEELDLSATGITDGALGALAQLRSLKVLRISQTAVTDTGIAKLVPCKQLEELDVENTAVTAEAMAQLREYLPHLKAP